MPRAAVFISQRPQEANPEAECRDHSAQKANQSVAPGYEAAVIGHKLDPPRLHADGLATVRPEAAKVNKYNEQKI